MAKSIIDNTRPYFKKKCNKTYVCYIFESNTSAVIGGGV